eukprot:jgi/Phyca11/21907/fgenesh1_pg.PHYCAscaffold_210_\
MTVSGEEQVSELGVERLGGTDADLGNTGTGPARQGALSLSSTDDEEGAVDPSTGVRTAARRLSIRQALRGDLEAAGDDGGTEGSEHPPALDDVKEEVKTEPRAQEEWMISGGEEGAAGDHEEMGQYAEEEAFQGEYVTDPEEGREYDIDEYGKYYLSGYYGDADEEEVKPPAQSSSGFIPLYTGAEKRRSDRPSTSWGWDPSRGAMQVQMVTVPSPTGVKSTQRRMQAAHDSSPARDIPEACEWLMFKAMHRPTKEDDDFSDGQPSQYGDWGLVEAAGGRRTPVVNVVDGTVMKDRTMSPPDGTTATACSGSDAEATVSGDGTESDENMVCSNILSLGGLLEPDAITEDEGPVSVLCGVRRAGMK